MTDFEKGIKLKLPYAGCILDVPPYVCLPRQIRCLEQILQNHLADHIVPRKSVKVKDAHVQLPDGQLFVRHRKLEGLVERRVERLPVDAGLELLAVRQQVDFDIRVRGATQVLGRQVHCLEDVDEESFTFVIVLEGEVYPAAVFAAAIFGRLLGLQGFLLVELWLDAADAGLLFILVHHVVVSEVQAANLHLPGQVPLKRAVSAETELTDEFRDFLLQRNR